MPNRLSYSPAGSPRRGRVSRLLFLALLCLLILGMALAAAYRTNQRLRRSSDWAAHTRQALRRLSDLLSDVKDAETNQRGYLLTNDPPFLAAYISDCALVTHDLGDLQRITGADPALQQKIAALKPLIAAKMSELQTTVLLQQTGHHDKIFTVMQSGQGKARMDRISAAIADMLNAQQQRLDSERQVTDSATSGAQRLIEVGVLLAASLAGLAAMIVGQYLREARLNENTLESINFSALQSEQRYRFLADSMPQIVWTSNREGEAVYYNQRWYEYTGLDPNSTRAGAWQPVLHPDDTPGAVAARDRSLKTGEAYEIEYRLRRADGQWRWHLGRVLPQRDETGAIVQWVGTGTDIDDFQRATDALRQANETLEHRVQERTAELRESKRFADSVAENSTSIIFVFDLAAMTNVYANRSVGDFLGYTADQVQALGSDLLSAILHPDDRPGVQSHFGQFAGIADGEVVELEYRVRHSSGEWCWIWSRETVFKRRADGTPCQIMGTAQDITERKRQEAALEQDCALLASVVSIQNEIIEAELGVSAVMELVAARAQELTHAAGAVVEMAEGDSLVYRIACGTMADHLGTRIPIGASLSGQSLTTDSVLICQDTLHDPRVHAALCAALQIRSMVVVPLHQEHQAIGVLKVLSPLPNAFTERESQTLQLMAGLITTAISRAAQFEAEQALLSGRTTALTKLAESEAQFRSAIDAMQEGLVVQDWDSKILVCNGIAEKFMGLSAQQLIGETAECPNWRFIHEDGSEFLRETQPSRMALHTGQPQPAQVIGRADEDGREIWLSVSAAPLFHAGETVPYAAVTTFSDITERRLTEQDLKDYQIVLEFQKQELEKANVQLETLATSDGLTGLKNHRAFQERLAEEFARAARYQTPLSVLMLDVDRFKEYNDEFGHPAGDRVLRQVGRLLQETMRESDHVARYGGEEFAVVLPLTDGMGAQILAERCRIVIQEACWDKRLITASFGIATLTPDIGDPHMLITRADQAMYAAKAGGRNRVSFAHALPAQIETETRDVVYLG